MSSDEARVTPEELVDLPEVRSIDDLERWSEDPFGGADVGAETVAQARLGQTEPVLVHGDLVVWGGVMVEAERHQPLNDGTVTVVDAAKAGWSLDEAKAEALRRHRRWVDTFVDRPMLAEVATEVFTADPELAAAVGWTEDELAGLMATLDMDPLVFDDEPPAGGGGGSVTCPACSTEFVPSS